MEKAWLEGKLSTIPEDGLPDFNEVVVHFLRRSNVSVEAFGKLYGQAVREKPYTKVRLYQMIQEKSFPTDPKRRWVIAKLLHIPPVLLGVGALDDLIAAFQHEKIPEEPERAMSLSGEIKDFDIRECEQALAGYWDLNFTNTVVTAWKEIERRIDCLEQVLLYGSWGKRQRSRLISLLCEYHMLLVNVALDQEWYDTAITHSNQTYRLAKNEKLPELQAAILHRRGSVFENQACSYENLLDFDAARQYFLLAQNDFTKALEFEASLSPGLKGASHARSGLMQTHLASDPWNLHQALKEIDKAEQFVGKYDGMAPGLPILDQERYHLDRAEAYLNAQTRITQYPGDARRELRNAAAAQVKPNSKRRRAYSQIILAKSYLVEQEYETATQVAGEALAQVKMISSSVNLARIAALCRVLEESGYGKEHIEVATLEVEVAKVQHPTIFQ